MSGCCRWDGEDLVLLVRVQPRASRDSIVGLYGDGLIKVAVTAPPVDGKANGHLRRFLAKAFGVAASAVLLESGDTGRHKRLRIRGPRKIPSVVGELLGE